jgi:hypothetical protein
MQLFGKPEPEPELESEAPGFLPPMDSSTPTTEPKLTQLDPESREIILNTIYTYGLVRDEESGKVSRVITGKAYPELERALAFAASHLNSVMFFRWEQAQAQLLYWMGLFFNPLSLRFKKDPAALQVLDVLDLMLRRSILGGSEGGSHQRYNVQMAGAHRTFEVRRDASR